MASLIQTTMRDGADTHHHQGQGAGNRECHCSGVCPCGIIEPGGKGFILGIIIISNYNKQL